MHTYKKPVIVDVNSSESAFPAVLIGMAAKISAAKLLAAGAAAGLAVGVAKGNSRISSTHTSTLTTRKNFALA